MTTREAITLAGQLTLIIALGALGAWYEWQKFKFYTGAAR